MQLIQALVSVAAGVFLALGTLHGLLTLRDLADPRAFTPIDPALRRAMQASGVRLHPSINLWKAWLGFNLSHSLGLVLFGAAYLYMGLCVPALFAGSPLLQGCAIGVSALYLLLSLKFWFSNPAIGSAVGLTCFTVAVVLANLR